MKTYRLATLCIVISALFVSAGCAVEEETSAAASSESYATSNASPGQFELFKGNNDQWYFRLRSANHEIVLASEGYTRKASAKNGIASVENNGIDITNYQIKEAKNGQWYFTLRAGNYQVIGSSETYETKRGAEHGAEGVQALIIRVLRFEADAHFDIFRGNDEQFYFNLRAGNGEIVLQSEGYTAKHNARNGIESVRGHGKDLRNYDIVEASNGEFYFNLVAANDEIIGTSETYVSKYNAQRGAETIVSLLSSERVGDAD